MVNLLAGFHGQAAFEGAGCLRPQALDLLFSALEINPNFLSDLPFGISDC